MFWSCASLPVIVRAPYGATQCAAAHDRVYAEQFPSILTTGRPRGEDARHHRLFLPEAQGSRSKRCSAFQIEPQLHPPHKHTAFQEASGRACSVESHTPTTGD
ncbi:hypothetical protein PV04_04096 [Phialophora macrospora]|uniref:Uncharacterized protein n=1 Tax=Phialophora macrospora TaxID=1851006 RepID=A0A0D2G893_9EURO|nr:hypothetical protein PV04_04096 [Phialophora macrospora]